jgi:hypothetical protein
MFEQALRQGESCAAPVIWFSDAVLARNGFCTIFFHTVADEKPVSCANEECNEN